MLVPCPIWMTIGHINGCSCRRSCGWFFLSMFNLIIESLVQNQKYAPVTQEEVSQAIKYINKGKSADYLGLTIEHILFSGNNMINLLTSLLNKIFNNREIPNSLKIGLLSPIFKSKGSKTQSTNYRGITILPVISQILETVIKNRIQSYVLQSQSRNQRGFTAGASPLNSALPVEESYRETIDNKSEYNLILGTDHLTWRGVYGFLFRSEISFRTTQELEYFFFCRAKRNFFSRI